MPCLYLGSKPDTALSEIRPHTGDRACVAEFTPKRQLDSNESKETLVKPFQLFLLTDPSEMGKMLEAILLNDLVGELILTCGNNNT